MLGGFTRRTPQGPLDHPFHLSARLLDLGKHEALKECISTGNFDSTRHTSSQLVPISKKLVASTAIQLENHVEIKAPEEQG